MNWPISDFAMSMLVAILIDVSLGWPDFLYKRIGHPVTWIGRLVDCLDSRLNTGSHQRRRLNGIGTVLIVVGVTSGTAFLAALLVPQGIAGIILAGVIAWPLVAARSMYEHCDAVAQRLNDGDLPGARHAVSMIVGRDPSKLDQGAVARAGLESLAENSSDGVVAPVFWGVLLGLPGIAAYKAVNTLDSMIGHRNDRFRWFGWASAKTDDLANFIPARLTGMLFAIVSAAPRRAIDTMLKDARRHRSPNAGWPEAALAGALGVRLSGPRVYDGKLSDEPWVNASGRNVERSDLAGGLRIFTRLVLALVLILVVVGLAGTGV